MSDALLSTQPRATDRAMAVVIVGTDHHPFDRLMRWIDDASSAGPSLGWLVQSGTSAPPRRVESRPYLTRPELEGALAEASLVVCHGGPGTIADARSAGHTPIVVPRLRALGEHVDDHQVRFARRLARMGRIRLAEDDDRFRACLRDAAAAPPRRGEARAPTRRPCDRFIALADQLLEEPPRGLLAALVDRKNGRAA